MFIVIKKITQIFVEVRSKVLTASSMKMAFFCVVALSNGVEDERRFKNACCFRYHGDSISPEDRCHSHSLVFS
jgi:hypothetical protein